MEKSGRKTEGANMTFRSTIFYSSSCFSATSSGSTCHLHPKSHPISSRALVPVHLILLLCILFTFQSLKSTAFASPPSSSSSLVGNKELPHQEHQLEQTKEGQPPSTSSSPGHYHEALTGGHALDNTRNPVGRDRRRQQDFESRNSVPGSTACREYSLTSSFL